MSTVNQKCYLAGPYSGDFIYQFEISKKYQIISIFGDSVFHFFGIVECAKEGQLDK
jgi:hypothetical protein